MFDDASIGPWLRGLDPVEADRMQSEWERFMKALFAIVCTQPDPRPSDVGDDCPDLIQVLLNARVNEGFKQVNRQSDLWWLLLCTINGQMSVETEIVASDKLSEIEHNADGIGTKNPTKELFFALVSINPNQRFLDASREVFRHLIRVLREPKQRRIAVATIEGCRPREIAERLQVVPSTIIRKLRIIRDTWRIEANYEILSAKFVRR